MLKNIIIITILIAVFSIAYIYGIQQYFSIETLYTYRDDLELILKENLILAIITFILVYIAAVVFSLPIASYLTVLGGFLFGSIQGTLFSVISATIGATILFILARSVLQDMLKAKFSHFIEKMSKGFNENAFSYLMTLRLIPAFPFVAVNIIPAFFNVSVKMFSLTTFLGIIPASFVFVQIGTGLDSILDQRGELSFENVLTLDLIIALVGLAMLSLMPVIYKYFKKKREIL